MSIFFGNLRMLMENWVIQIYCIEPDTTKKTRRNVMICFEQEEFNLLVKIFSL